MQVADFNQFGSTKPGIPGDPQHCARCEAMLTDALDGTLSAADQAAFDLHMVGCPNCATMLADAQRGAAWMEMLKSSRPEPPASLLERIFAQTSNPPAPPIVLGPTDRLRVHPPQVPNTLLGRPVLVPTATGNTAVYASTNVLPFRSRITYGLRSLGHTMLQPRLAMTAAMAFFSIALTLNLTGVHLSNLRASDLKPSSIMRSCYEAKARVVRYSDNLRVVYELESRVRDLQRSSDDNGSTSTPAPQNTPAKQSPDDPQQQQQPDGQNPGSKNPDQKQNRPRPKPGSSRREAPAGNLLLAQFVQLPSFSPSPTQDLVVVSPNIFKHEGGLA
jgi:Putative zinc-finger